MQKLNLLNLSIVKIAKIAAIGRIVEISKFSAIVNPIPIRLLNGQNNNWGSSLWPQQCKAL